MNAFKEADRMVGHHGEAITTFPTPDEVSQAIQDEDYISLLQWQRFLRPPQTSGEAELVTTISRTVLQMTPAGYLREIAAPPPALANDPTVIAGEHATCLICYQRYSAVNKLSWLAIGFAKNTGICNFCGPHLATAQLWATFHKERPALAEQAAEIIIQARNYYRLGKPAGNARLQPGSNASGPQPNASGSSINTADTQIQEELHVDY